MISSAADEGDQIEEIGSKPFFWTIFQGGYKELLSTDPSSSAEGIS